MILKALLTKSFFLKLTVVCFLCTFSHLIIAKTVHIGIIIDGTSKRQTVPIAQIKREIIKLNQGEFTVKFPANKVINAGWQLDKIRAAISTLNQDNSIDLIITQGLIASHEAAHFNTLNKPVIAPVIADRVLQGLPYNNGISNKHNYTYIASSQSIEQDIRQFFKLTPFKQLLIPIDPVILHALPTLRTITNRIQNELGFNLTFLPVNTRLKSILQEMPSNIDAVYLPPFARFSDSDHKAFADGLISRKIPSFSLLGRKDLELGFMATLNGREMDSLRFSRRIALMVQSILLGTNPAKLKVDLEQPTKLAINMKTAKAIGFSPKWRDLESAELLFQQSIQKSDILSLTDAMNQAVAANLGLLSDKVNIALAEDQVYTARSTLLPQINIGLSGTHIDQSRSGAQQAQRTADAEIQLSQLIYSELSWSGFDVARLLKDAEDASFQTRVLDVLSQSSTAYLRVLSALGTEQVRQANLKVSESNLELAQQRVKIGYSNRSEVLRWKSVIASDRSALYIAQAAREQNQTELKRLLHTPFNESVSVTNEGISSLIAMLQNEKFKGFFDNAVNFNHFIDFEVQRALNNAPELKQLSHLTASARRKLVAGKRAYYIPDISINARFGQNIDQGGIGAQNSNLHKDNWSAGFQATLPLFTSGARPAEISRASNTLIQTRYQQQNIQEVIEARVRSALQKTKGSFPSIRLSQDAAKAAKENFAMVSDSYLSGAVSITSLIDAQNASLSADLSAVEALYSFMIDWVEIQRSVANFDLILSDTGINLWYQELDAFYRKGVGNK
ncbi:MAG: TolC family protein [Methylococcaceae bacterium]|nr:TolC family protein [Methylococcaceae bacterium]